jgi:SAM-dependent methyltransferase
MPLSIGRRANRPFKRYTLALWLRSARGQRQIDLEQQELRRVLPDVFGRHMLQIGSWGRGDELLQSTETLHRAVIGTVADLGAQALATPEELPVATKSVDGVVLPHTLEFTQQPHNVLREAARVLTDRGRLFVIGFNPLGSFVMRQRLGLGDRDFPPPSSYYGIGRLHDWLELLDFEVTEVRRFGAGFPWIAPRTQGVAWSLGSLLAPLAESYLLVAKKRVLPVNFVGRTQRAQVKPLIGAVGAGAASNTAANSSAKSVNPVNPVEQTTQ